jgi:Flp pilus assembly protein TadG
VSASAHVHRDGWARGERGAALVEFAIVFPLLALIVFGIIQFGTTYNNYEAVRQGVRDAAREGVVGQFGTNTNCGLTGLTSANTQTQELMCLTKTFIGVGNSTRVKVLVVDSGLAPPNGALVVCAQYPQPVIDWSDEPVPRREDAAFAGADAHRDCAEPGSRRGRRDGAEWRVVVVVRPQLTRRMRVQGDERGAVLAFVAVTMTVMLGMLALVVDLGVARETRLQSQASTDAAALAAAQDLPNVGDSAAMQSADADQARASALRYARDALFTNGNLPALPTCASGVVTCTAKLGDATLTITTPYGPIDGIANTQLVYVQACRPIPVFFAHIFGVRSRTGCRSSVARKNHAYVIPNPGMVVLQQTNPCTGIDLSGSTGASINSTGSVVVDCPSNPPDTFAGSNAQINATTLYTVGTCTPTSQCTNGATTPVNQLTTPVNDPLAALPALAIGDAGVTTLTTAAFNNLPCLDGIYYVTGNPGSTVSLIRTCPNKTSMEYLTTGIGINDSIKTNIALNPPTNGTYTGISIFLAHGNTATINTTMNNQGSLTTGTIYAPDGSINAPSGNVNITINGQLIVQSVTIKGGGGPKNTALQINPPNGTPSITTNDVGLER